MKVAILMGSPRDAEKMLGASEMLDRFNVPHEVHVMSAHRAPAQVAELATDARANGYGVIICGAGMAAHLAGAVSAHTTLPVIGVPLSGGLGGGLDALPEGAEALGAGGAGGPRGPGAWARSPGRCQWKRP